MAVRVITILMALMCQYKEVNAQGAVSASINNLRSDRGVCRACLFQTAASFVAMVHPVSCQTISIRERKAFVYFYGLPPGSYAMLVFHDENNNGKMDRTFLGIPKEGYGASNNHLPFASAPSFESSQFSVRDKEMVSKIIRLRYIF